MALTRTAIERLHDNCRSSHSLFPPCISLYKARANREGITAPNTFTRHTTAPSLLAIAAMIKVILFVSLVGAVVCQPQPGPDSSYGAPTSQQNGFGNGNRLNNGYSAPANGRANGASGTNGDRYNAPGNGANGGNGRFKGGSNGLSSAYGAPGGAEAELAELAASLPGGGVPGEDFPVLSEVPDTGFQCGDQAVSGYYADDDGEARCQVFHICQLRESGLVQQDSFLCPNGTVFNQQYLVCDWWFNFDCSQAKDFYSVNELIGVVENGAYGASTSGQNGNGYSQAGNRKGASNGGRQNGNGYSNGNGNGAASLSSGYAAPAKDSNRNGGYA
ncbi:Chitin binding domain [Trinorchestia longiramus]|nr:Chitin binding domain [Trinorchestia longiramus]